MRTIATTLFPMLLMTASRACPQAVTPPVPLQATILSDISSITYIDCGSFSPRVAACIDNRSAQLRQNNYHSFRAYGTGTWSVQMYWADGTPATWVSYGSTAIVSNASPSSAIGYGIDPANASHPYHDFIKFVFTGSVTVQSYFGTKKAWWTPSVGGISYPLSVNQGGTGILYPTFYYDRISLSAKAGCAAAKAGGYTWLATTTWTNEVAGTYDCDKMFIGGGKIQFASSAAVLMKGSITASPTQQIFDVTTNSGVTITAADNTAMATPITPFWFGALGDGVTDDAIPMQYAFSFLGSSGAGNPRSGKLLLAAPYIIGSTILLKNFSGDVQCQGWGVTSEAAPLGNYIKWKTGASSGIPMFQYDNSAGMYWTGCQFIGNIANPPSAALNCKAGAFGGGAGTQLNQFDSIKIGSLSGVNQFQSGILIDGTNTNCDTHQFNNTEIRNTGTAVNQQNSQNVNWNFYNLQCVANSVACISAAGTVNIFGGSFAGNHVDYTYQGSGTNPTINTFGVVDDGGGRWVDTGDDNRTPNFLAIGGSYNIKTSEGAINDGSCGPDSNPTLYANCNFFVKADQNWTGAVTFRALGVKISGDNSVRPMFNFGKGSNSGSPRSVTVEDITTTCPNALLGVNNWLISTATGASSKQYYHFQGCENWTYRSGVYGANATFQPTDGVTEEFNIHAQTLTLPTVTPVTFTPVLSFGGNSTGITYTQQYGASVVVGSLTYVNITLVLLTKGAQTGVATITGLPVAQNNGNNAHFGASIAYANGLVATNAVIGGIFEGSGRVDLYSQAAGTSSPLTEANFSDTTNLQLTLVYAQ